MRLISILFSINFLLAASSGFAQSGNRNAPSQPDRLVVVGDSLSAGVQNFSLLYSQQPHGYASVIAEQGDWNLTLPLVPYPGIPNVLQLESLGPPVVIEPAPGKVPFFRLNPFIQPTNISVPGATVASALTLRPDISSTNPEQVWATVVLGFPSLFRGQAPTEVELAQSLKPNTVIEWLGNNDALVPAIVGLASAPLTPIDQFAAAYKQILDALSQTGAKLVTATIPDVTEVAYFTSPQTIAKKAGISVSVVTELLGIGPNDYVRPSAQAYIDAILTSGHGPLPSSCPSPLPDLGVSTIPCVLTAADAATIRSTVDCYNQIIAQDTAQHGGMVVDIHALVDRIYSEGYEVAERRLTTDFLGGLFSLDGIHPTDTGYGIIANEFITQMNAFLGKNMQQANLGEIFAHDPLRNDAFPDFTPRSVPPSSCPASALTLTSSAR
jgi:phospholipase/lecithinase/hemolysin